MAKSITLEELEAELTRCDSDGGGGLSTAEMASAMGVCATVVNRQLQKFKAEGRLRCTFRSKADITGRIGKIPVYSVLPKKKRK